MSNEKTELFMSRLMKTNFRRLNREFLDKYLGNGMGSAFAHIKASHKELVVGDGWSERKFTDLTYIISKDKKTYTSATYRLYEYRYYNKELNDDILIERERYKYKSKERTANYTSLMDLV